MYVYTVSVLHMLEVLLAILYLQVCCIYDCNYSGCLGLGNTFYVAINVLQHRVLSSPCLASLRTSVLL